MSNIINIKIRKAQLRPCVRVCIRIERSAVMPEGRARGACPEEALKGPRKGHGGRRPAGSAGGGEGCPPPSKKFPQIFFFLKIISEAAAGHQGVLEGGREGGTPHKKSRQFFLPKLSLKRPQAARGCWRGVGRGCLVGVQHACLLLFIGLRSSEFYHDINP